ncbi:hypothetical protein BD310DRAFT_831012 [Dichomitus squalens]|uniref:Uncharacterized protein n=1 Tax=Dichomitus squalens TaxID=114155 RepID=A0A4Q9PIA4_9APHY|nr:hypothetical protein BD310DRAFT_831012 [Dichomitus squalens]
MTTGISYEAIVHEPSRLNLNTLIVDPCTIPGSLILGTSYNHAHDVAVFLILVFRPCRAHHLLGRTWKKETRPNLSVSTKSLADTYRTLKHKPSSSSTLYDISEEPTTPLDHTPNTTCHKSPSPPYATPRRRSETGFLPVKV